MIKKIVELHIEDLSSYGEGLGFDGKHPIFVDGALPGEIVEAEVLISKKKYSKARVLKILKASRVRVKPPCPLFNRCGGCQVMHLAYQSQLESKRKKVLDALERIGKFTDVTVDPCQASPKEFHYRNKIQLPVKQGSEGLDIGLYEKRSHHLVPLEHCLIHCELGDRICAGLLKLLKKTLVTAYDPKYQRGDLRFILIKSALKTEEVLVTLVSAKKASKALKELAHKIFYLDDAVKGVVLNVNFKPGNTVLGPLYECLEGVDTIEENLGGMKFRVSPASFFQVNPQQAEKLYEAAIQAAGLGSDDVVLDAFCGVGTLSLLLSKRVKRVLGVECVSKAILDAKANAKRNNCYNVEFFCEKAENFIQNMEAVDCVVMNPPRKGCEKAFLERVGNIQVDKIVYISCDPATLARDCAILNQFGYKISKVSPFDMFPQTGHVETVVFLVKF